MNTIKHKLIQLFFYFENFFIKRNLLKIAKVIRFFRKEVSLLFDYFLFALSGLIMDLLIFSFLIYIVKIEIFFANLVSLYSAATITYFALGEKIFRGFHFTRRKYYYYVSYITVSVILFSFIIDYLNNNLIEEPIISKLVIIFIAVVSNYIFFTNLMKHKSG